MDHFNVPKKVNRHVLKALSFLSGGNHRVSVSTTSILHQVKYQMRNLIPVRDIDGAIQKSLKNLCEIGVVERQGLRRYVIGRCCAAADMPHPPSSGSNQRPERKLFRSNVQRQRSFSNLDPNLKTQSQVAYSDDSLSGDEFDRTRKRLHTNNKDFKHKGYKTDLPRARQHYNNLYMHPVIEIDNPLLTCATTSLGSKFEHSSAEYLGLAPHSESNQEFMFANLTPATSLQITEISNIKADIALGVSETSSIKTDDDFHNTADKSTTAMTASAKNSQAQLAICQQAETHETKDNLAAQASDNAEVSSGALRNESSATNFTS